MVADVTEIAVKARILGETLFRPRISMKDLRSPLLWNGKFHRLARKLKLREIDA